MSAVDLVVVARVLLVVVFATAGIAKALDRGATRRTLVEFGVPPALAPVASWMLIVAELTTAAALTWSVTAWAGGILALVLLLLFCVAAGVNLARGRAPECNCFGQVHSEPVSPRLLFRNAGFAVLALIVVVGGRSDAGPSLWAWCAGLTGVEIGLLVAVVGLALAVVVLARRLRSAEAATRSLADQVAAVAAVDTATEVRGSGGSDGAGEGVAIDAPGSSDPAEPTTPTFSPGLPVGTSAPAFSLAAMHGERTLAALLDEGKPLVLLFVAPTCATCHELLPKPATWAQTYGDVLSFALLTAGTPEANEGIEGPSNGFQPVLFDPGSARQAYEVAATPGGVVVGRDGVIESATVYGVAEIAMLVMRTAAAARASVPG